MSIIFICGQDCRGDMQNERRDGSKLKLLRILAEIRSGHFKGCTIGVIKDLGGKPVQN